MVRFPRLRVKLLLPVLCLVGEVARGQPDEARAEGYLREIAAMSELGADIQRIVGSDATRALVTRESRFSYLLSNFASGPGHRLARATAIFALGEIRDPDALALETLRYIRQKSDDPFLRDAAEASLAKILWWESGSDLLPEGASASSVAASLEVPEDWKQVMRSRLTYSQSEALAMIESASARRYVEWDDGHLNPREFAVFREHWDLSRRVVLDKLAAMPTDDPYVADVTTEIAVVAMTPLEDLQRDPGLQTLLRRFTGSSDRSIRLLATYGLARVGDTQAIATATRLGRESAGTPVARLFQSLWDHPDATNFAELWDAYFEAYFANFGPPVPDDDTGMARQDAPQGDLAEMITKTDRMDHSIRARRSETRANRPGLSFPYRPQDDDSALASESRTPPALEPIPADQPVALWLALMTAFLSILGVAIVLRSRSK